MAVASRTRPAKRPAKLALGNASMGFVRTETLRAFTEDEYRKIVGGLS